MPGQSIHVCPPGLLEAAATVSTMAIQAAQPDPGMVPEVGAGSAADTACDTFTAGVAARSGELVTRFAGKGPQVQATTHAGVSQLQAQDGDNATQVQAVGQSVEQPPVAI